MVGRTGAQRETGRQIDKQRAPRCKQPKTYTTESGEREDSQADSVRKPWTGRQMVQKSNGWTVKQRDG